MKAQPQTALTKQKTRKVNSKTKRWISLIVKVMKNLSEEKLLEVATNNKRLLPIGRCAIKHRYWNEFFKLSNKEKPNSVDFTLSTKMIQLFGNEIRCLMLIYEEEDRHFDHRIEQLVMDFCSESLNKIHIVNSGRSLCTKSWSHSRIWRILK